MEYNSLKVKDISEELETFLDPDVIEALKSKVMYQYIQKRNSDGSYSIKQVYCIGGLYYEGERDLAIKKLARILNKAHKKYGGIMGCLAPGLEFACNIVNAKKYHFIASYVAFEKTPRKYNFNPHTYNHLDIPYFFSDKYKFFKLLDRKSVV